MFNLITDSIQNEHIQMFTGMDRERLTSVILNSSASSTPGILVFPWLTK